MDLVVAGLAQTAIGLAGLGINASTPQTYLEYTQGTTANQHTVAEKFALHEEMQQRSKAEFGTTKKWIDFGS